MAFLSVVGPSFDLSFADATGFVSLDHLGPVGATELSSSAAPLISEWAAQSPRPRSPIFRFSINKNEHLSAAAGSKTNLGGDDGALALPGFACSGADGAQGDAELLGFTFVP